MTTKKGKYIFRFPIKCLKSKNISHEKTNTNQLTSSSKPLHDVEKRSPLLLTPPHYCMAWKENGSPSCKRRVMVVADPTAESVAALQYVLSHAMQDRDDLILIHVTQAPKRSPSIKSLFGRRHSDPGLAGISNFDPASAATEGGCKDFLEVMKRTSEGAYPNSRVWVEKVEQGNLDNKGDVILLRCKELLVDLLVIGQRRHLASVLLGPRRSFSIGSTNIRGVSKSVETVEYLIENSPCICVAVQKKGQNSGYVINSRTHRNFWLLV